MLFVNLTPHDINIITPNDGTITVERSGTVARCAVESRLIAELNGIPIYQAVYGAVDGLPAPRPDVYYIVSLMVRQVVPDRWDVLSPGELVRNEAGQPIGCKGLNSN